MNPLRIAWRLRRNEPWLLAAGFAIATLRDGWRGRLEPAAKSRRLGAAAALIGVYLIACGGWPIAWHTQVTE